MTRVAPRTNRQSRPVAFVYGGIAGAILMAVAAVALVVVPPSPPSVAEFSPSAEETIDEAPDQQSSQFGDGGAAGGSCVEGQEPCAIDPVTGALVPVTTAQAPEIVKSRVRRCVGDPPRQTEDPQSPACVNYFEGDNGGSTYKGVTRDEIRVGAPQQFVANYESTYRLILEHFNRRYELYGRKLRLYVHDMSCCTPATEQAAAARMDELDVFASSSPGPGGGHRTFVAEMARQRRVSLDASLTLESSEEVENFAPYFYSFRPGVDVALRSAGELYCRSLHGSPAAFAGPDIARQPRKIAVIDYERPQGPADASPMLDSLARCGASPGKAVVWPRSTGTTDTRQRSAALDLRNQGVTTVSCVCNVGEFRGVKAAFGDVGYQPELLMAGIPRHDSDFLFQTDNDRRRMFGLTSANKTLPLSNEPWVQAVKEVAPDYQATSSNAEIYRDFYDQMRLLASGIQAAGPTLTPETLEAGLSKTRFPNPGSAAAPNWQAGGSFSPGDHTFVEDFALIYWSETGESYSGTKPTGTFCYIERGARWAAGQWPKRPHPFFDPTAPCR